MVDGGIVANDPVMFLVGAVKQAALGADVGHVLAERDLLAVDFGTGREVQGDSRECKRRDRGPLRWNTGQPNIITATMQGSSDAIHANAKDLLDGAYLRIDPWLPRRGLSWDDPAVVPLLRAFVEGGLTTTR